VASDKIQPCPAFNKTWFAIKYGQDDAIFELEAAELGYSLLTGNSPAEAAGVGMIDPPQRGWSSIKKPWDVWIWIPMGWMSQIPYNMLFEMF
jgi:hypothetical protein